MALKSKIAAPKDAEQFTAKLVAKYLETGDASLLPEGVTHSQDGGGFRFQGRSLAFGDYLVEAKDGTKSVMARADFEAAFTIG